MQSAQLIKTATEKGFKVDQENFPGMIGINKGKHVWHWFNVWPDGEVSFDHSYSQNTGSTKKGTMHAISVKEGLGFYSNVSNY